MIMNLFFSTITLISAGDGLGGVGGIIEHSLLANQQQLALGAGNFANKPSPSIYQASMAQQTGNHTATYRPTWMEPIINNTTDRPVENKATTEVFKEKIFTLGGLHHGSDTATISPSDSLPNKRVTLHALNGLSPQVLRYLKTVDKSGSFDFELTSNTPVWQHAVDNSLIDAHSHSESAVQMVVSNIDSIESIESTVSNEALTHLTSLFYDEDIDFVNGTATLDSVASRLMNGAYQDTPSLVYLQPLPYTSRGHHVEVHDQGQGKVVFNWGQNNGASFRISIPEELMMDTMPVTFKELLDNQ